MQGETSVNCIREGALAVSACCLHEPLLQVNWYEGRSVVLKEVHHIYD
jgi:hypothetical protein